MRYYVTYGEREIEVDLAGDIPMVDGQPVPADMIRLPGSPVRHLIAQGRAYPVLAEAAGQRGRWKLVIGATRFTLAAVDERTRAIRELTASDVPVQEKSVSAPMPGLVLRVAAEVGQEVSAGQGLVVVEAMKMENELKAPVSGVVTAVLVTPGQTVEKGARLVVLE